MSDGSWKMVFNPLSGEFQLKKVGLATPAGSGVSGSIINGTLVLPGGLELEIAGGLAVLNGSEILLEPGAQLLVLA